MEVQAQRPEGSSGKPSWPGREALVCVFISRATLSLCAAPWKQLDLGGAACKELCEKTPFVWVQQHPHLGILCLLSCCRFLGVMHAGEGVAGPLPGTEMEFSPAQPWRLGTDYA